MKVFKFGGASVKDAEAVKNVARIVQQYPDEPLVIVISAMGKTTNALERLAESYFHKSKKVQEQFEEIRAFHYVVLEQLFENKEHPVFERVETLFADIEERLEREPIESFDYIYDQIIPVGELLSTTIVSAYLQQHANIKNKWLDARGLIRTDDNHREAHVQWTETIKAINEQIPPIIEQQPVVTQGFIGATLENTPTTLGREGSDYTAAILASVLEAEEVIVWKDVPGVLTADPKQFDFAEKIERLSYYEAVEMTYYGAKVLHPKTIKPLENKQIPLYVRSFVQPKDKGTTITYPPENEDYPPIVIRKKDQVLLSFITKDYSFISEENLSLIYRLFAEFQVQMNTVQIAAVSFSVCVDNQPGRLAPLITELKKNFKVLTNQDLTLYTVRHYQGFELDKLLTDQKVYLEQRSRHTLQLVTTDASN
jgi:aspartate kinase